MTRWLLASLVWLGCAGPPHRSARSEAAFRSEVEAQVESAPEGVPEPCGAQELGPLQDADSVSVLHRWSGLGCTYAFSATVHRQDAAFYAYTTTVANERVEGHLLEGRWEPVARFLSTMAELAAAPRPADEGRIALSWTDDYPAAELIVRRDGKPPLILFFADQGRAWQLAIGERTCPIGSPAREDPSLQDAYRDMLTSLGLDEALRRLCQSEPLP